MPRRLEIYFSPLGLRKVNPLWYAATCNSDGFHIDVMDGLIVPNYSRDDRLIPKLKKLKKPIQIHLMVKITEEWIDEMIYYQPDTIFLHPEWTVNVEEVTQKLRDNNIKVGIVWNNNDISHNFFTLADEILFMTVEPGFSGQTLIHNRLGQIRTMMNGVQITQKTWIDGGVKSEFIDMFDEMGMTGVISGSRIQELVGGIKCAQV